MYFDPEVIGPGSVKPGQEYIGPVIIITDDEGNPMGFGNDQGGISYNIDLPEVVITGRPKSNSFWSRAGGWTQQKTSDFASSFVYVGTAVGSSVYNAANEIIHEGVHPGGPYDRSLYSGKVYKLENWKLKVIIDYQNKSHMTNDESNELAMSTMNVALAPVRVVPGVNISKSVLVNKAVATGANMAIKAALKAPVKTVLE